MSGNFAPWSAQEAFARDLASQIRQDFPGAKLTATGHSLGGALAKVAVEGTDEAAIVFNTSPRGDDSDHIIRIEESGDVLDYFRENHKSDIQFDFQQGTAWEAHRMYPLAEGMRLMAGQH